jgi:predicted phosphoadenosine phosphosulfate sulfurtransferase
MIDGEVVPGASQNGERRSRKAYLEQNVFEAAEERLDLVFREFDQVYVSFSGGKDSGVLLNLAIEAARRAGKLPLTVLTIDMEAQYAHTISHVERMLSRPEVRPYWVCLPIHLRNAVSQFQPHWICWDEEKRDAWVRQLPDHPGVISDPTYFPFFRKGMEFEEFVPAFGEWFAGGEKTACLVAIRSDESLNRFRTISSRAKGTYQNLPWSTDVGEGVYNFYPIYDWRTEDIWTANGRMGWDYNRIYDLMHLAGLSLHQMRLCQPFGDDQRKGLYLFKILEPETWAKLVNRVEGANFGNRYTESQSHTLGNFKTILPPGHTYRSYAHFLLDTMPPHVAEHYRGKIAKFIRWWRKEGKAAGFDKFPDAADPRLEAARKAPSWRRIVKVLLKNDYWCKGLSFTQTKRDMERQLAILTKYMSL